MLDNILDPPHRPNSNIPTWQTVTLPHASFPEDVFTLSQIKISDDHVLILTEENDPEYNPEKTPPVPGVSILLQIPRIKQFFLLNLNTLHVERVRCEMNLSNTFARGMGPYRLFLDENRSFLCLEGGEKLTLWRFNLSEDFKTIVSTEQKCKENLSLRPIGKVVLYKQKLYILTFLPVSKSSTGGGGGLFGGGGSAEPQTYNEKVFTIDIETGKCAEQVTLGTKPVPRMGYSAALYENQIFLFGGSVNYPHSPKINYNFEDLWTLDLDTFTWKELPFQVSPSARSSAAVCSVEDKIYIFGGSTQDSVGRPKKNSELYLYDIRRNTWQYIQTNSQGLEDSRVYLHNLIFHKDKLFICNNMRIHFLQIDKLPKNGEKKQSCKASDTSSQSSRQRIIFTERPFPDITFKVEQKEIPAHKAILYSGSTFFRNMFTSGMEESNKNVIEIPNMKASAFEALLEYIYCGTVEINDDIAWEVLQEADKYALPGLKTICEDFLASCITVENVVQTINMSEKYEANSLRTAALKYVAKNVDKVFEEADIHQIKKSTLLEIYKLKP